MMLEECITLFLEEKSLSSAPRTMEFYTDGTRKFKNWYMQHYSPGDFLSFSRRDYMQYIMFLRQSGIKNTSLAAYHRAVRAFANWLAREGCLEKSFASVKLPRPDPEVIEPLTETEVQRLDGLLTFTEHFRRNWLIFHLMLDMGLRRQEVVNLQWDDVRDGWLVIRSSKYNRSRIVPCPCSIKNSLACYRGASRGDASVLKVTASAINNMFRRLKKKSGIKRLHPHLLRHTFATSFTAGGGSLEYLRMYMGHADYAVTRKYLHISMEYQINGIQIYRLDRIFFRNYNSPE